MSKTPETRQAAHSKAHIERYLSALEQFESEGETFVRLHDVRDLINELNMPAPAAGADDHALLVQAAQAFFDAKQAKIDFERENPGNTTKKWDACLYRVEAAEDALHSALKAQGATA